MCFNVALKIKGHTNSTFQIEAVGMSCFEDLGPSTEVPQLSTNHKCFSGIVRIST